MTTPLVSVMLPVRDEAPFLAEAIVVGDGSSDGSDFIAVA